MRERERERKSVGTLIFLKKYYFRERETRHHHHASKHETPKGKIALLAVITKQPYAASTSSDGGYKNDFNHEILRSSRRHRANSHLQF
jgi:hypothetical protein